jgi:hypothetical protein
MYNHHLQHHAQVNTTKCDIMLNIKNQSYSLPQHLLLQPPAWRFIHQHVEFSCFSLIIDAYVEQKLKLCRVCWTKCTKYIAILNNSPPMLVWALKQHQLFFDEETHLKYHPSLSYLLSTSGWRQQDISLHKWKS